MPKVEQNKTVLYLQSNGNEVNVDWRYKEFKNIWSYYDKNSDGKLDEKEIQKMKNDYKAAAGSDRVMDKNELKKFAAKFSASVSSVSQFFHDVDGDLIASDLKNKLQTGFFESQDLSGAEKLINRINKKNVNKVNYTYTDENKDGAPTLIEDVMDSFKFDKAAGLAKKMMTALASACKENKININNTIAEFNKAIANKDKKAVIKTVNDAAAMLDNAMVNKKQIKEHTGKFKLSKLGSGNMEKLKKMAASKNTAAVESDIAGDGVLGNHKSTAMTSEGKIVLDAVNTALKNKTLREKLGACIRKENSCLCAYIPKTKTTYPYTENGLVNENIIKNSTIGDGDMSLLVSAIMSEAEKANYKITSASSALGFIKELFE